MPITVEKPGPKLAIRPSHTLVSPSGNTFKYACTCRRAGVIAIPGNIHQNITSMIGATAVTALNTLFVGSTTYEYQYQVWATLGNAIGEYMAFICLFTPICQESTLNSA